MAHHPLVEMRHIYKAFGGIHAVEDVSVSVSQGEVVGIVGHNGAGKSTLIKILSGAYQMDSGEIFVNGEPASISNPRDAKHHGIETICTQRSDCNRRRAACACLARPNAAPG